jgi:antitoxin (DNA-binding transcriptional repressor) of toxin-antitoxin stability system
METVSIRDLRGADLQKRAREGKPLAITNHRALIGVIIPASSAWVEHLVFYNWSRIRHSVAEGELAATEALATPVSGPGGNEPGPGGRPDPGLAERPVLPLAATVVGETVVQTPESEEALEELRVLLNPARLAGEQDGGPAEPSVVRPIRIGDLSAAQIEKAGANGQTLAITHDRNLIGILIPVTQGLVQFLIERNISRVLTNIRHGEEQLSNPGEAGRLSASEEFLRASSPGCARSRSADVRGRADRPPGLRVNAASAGRISKT